MLFQSRSKVNSYVDFMKCILAVSDLETLFEQLLCSKSRMWKCVGMALLPL